MVWFSGNVVTSKRNSWNCYLWSSFFHRNKYKKQKKYFGFVPDIFKDWKFVDWKQDRVASPCPAFYSCFLKQKKYSVSSVSSTVVASQVIKIWKLRSQVANLQRKKSHVPFQPPLTSHSNGIQEFRNDDGNCNDNTTNQWLILIGSTRNNNRAARVARFLVQFFDVVCQMTTWNFHLEVLTTTRARSSKSSFFTYIKTIHAKQAKVHSAYFVQREQHRIISQHL